MTPHFLQCALLARYMAGGPISDKRICSVTDSAVVFRYTEVILVDRFEDKAVVIAEKGIRIYFDDQDEMLMHIPEDVTVTKVRNGGNFDSASKQWLYLAATGRQI